MGSEVPASTIHPFSPCFIISGPQVRSVVITGVPCDIASVITNPNPSNSEGNMNKSCAAIRANICSCGKEGI